MSGLVKKLASFLNCVTIAGVSHAQHPPCVSSCLCPPPAAPRPLLPAAAPSASPWPPPWPPWTSRRGQYGMDHNIPGLPVQGEVKGWIINPGTCMCGRTPSGSCAPGGSGVGRERTGRPWLLSVSARRHTCGLTPFSLQNCLCRLIAALQLQKL